MAFASLSAKPTVGMAGRGGLGRTRAVPDFFNRSAEGGTHLLTCQPQNRSSPLLFMRATFAHGLWSSPDSGKAEWLRSHGWEVHALDMRKLGWDQASQTRVVLEAIDEMGPFDVLIGSSFGGLATANAAAQRPELDLRLVLLAPALATSTCFVPTSVKRAWRPGKRRERTPSSRPAGRSRS